jgi:L-threonine-O-3-phosphate decarboxylase
MTDVQKSGPALHGGNVMAAARELNVSWRDILDYSANINPLGPPPGLKKHLFKSYDLTRHYPEPYAERWRLALADRLGLDPDEIVAGNGTTSLMYLAARALKPQRPVVAVPAFAEYEAALKQAGRPVRQVTCRPENHFDLTRDVVDHIFTLNPDLVFLANPTSPAGRLIDPEVMDRVLSLADQNRTVIVVDEAFIDFTPAQSLVSLVKRHPTLVVMCSQTKFFALPGLRLGFMAASRDLAARLTANLEPWSLNTLAVEAGLYCLNQDDYAERTRKTVTRERTWLSRKLEKLGLDVTPGKANYILVKLTRPGWDEDNLSAALKTKHILIRGCTSFQGILKGYIRLAVKTSKPNQRLITALTEVFGEE